MSSYPKGKRATQKPLGKPTTCSTQDPAHWSSGALVAPQAIAPALPREQRVLRSPPPRRVPVKSPLL